MSLLQDSMKASTGMGLSRTSKVPDRAIENIELEVKTSHIIGAGRGIFATDKVKAGDTIFSIRHPVLSMVCQCLI